MRRSIVSLFSLCLLTSAFAYAERPADIDTAGFERQTAEALALRAKRTIDAAEFLEMMARDDVVLLDTRSKAAYDRKHLEGAVHLNFSDFTAGKLAKVIPSKDTVVLIYCNNNIDRDPMDFARKMAPMALNIPTFINLYAYGYRNVYELGALVPITDPRFVFAGSAAHEIRPVIPRQGQRPMPRQVRNAILPRQQAR